jgi:uncharacterized SAM-binding protein YcdF (DUF218 family)
MTTEGREFAALVVLGCRVDPEGIRGALGRRLEKARSVVEERPLGLIVFSGGKRWNGVSEAEAMRAWWEREANSWREGELVIEEFSEDTLENAEHSAALLAERGITRIGLVTCDFHMRRATLLFEAQGLFVTPLPAEKERGLLERVRLRFREWGALQLLQGKRKRRP